jgi:hypothetical protein
MALIQLSYQTMFSYASLPTDATMILSYFVGWFGCVQFLKLSSTRVECQCNGMFFFFSCAALEGFGLGLLGGWRVWFRLC